MVVEKEKTQSFLEEKLLQSGYKLTPRRRAVLEAFQHHDEKHLSCEDIHKHLKKEYSGVSLATVYRIIHIFDNLGLLTKVDFDDKCTRYELNIPDENSHCHLVCLNCKKISEVKEYLIQSMESLIFKNARFTVKNRVLTFYGLCEECSTENINSDLTKC